MKKIYKSIFLTPFFLILSTLALAQCDFRGGDIAFTGYQIFDDNNDGSSKDDVFSFVLLRDAPAGLEIFFTDLGWMGTKFQEKESAPSDGIIKWSTDVDIPAGTQITITAKFNLTATIGQVTGVQNTQFGNYMDLGIAGDQLFAFTGTKETPILLAGININKPGWDTNLYFSTLTSSTSVNPFVNNNAIQSISIGYQTADNRKAYNAVLRSGTYSGKVPAIITLLNNPTNWVTDGTVYPNLIPPNSALPASATFTIAPPTITTQPKDTLVCPTYKAAFSVSVIASEVCAYFWEVSTDGVEYTPIMNSDVYSGVNNAKLEINNVEGLNGYFYRVKVKGAIETHSDPAKLEVILVSPIQTGPEGVNEITYGEQTSFSVTGSKYANSYEWQVSKDKGTTYQVIAVADNNYQGAKTNALKLVKPTVAMSGYLYRVRVADECESVDSDAIELSVQKKKLTVKAKNIIKIYDGLPFTAVEVGSYTGFEYNEDETVLNGTLAYQGEEAINASDDPYDIVIDGLDADNYEIVYENGELTIEPAPLTISAETKSKVYGTANPVLTYTYDGLVNGETSIPDLSVSTVADESSSVGDYPIVLSGSATNYTLTFVDGLLSITPKAVTITAENKSRVYGEMNPALTLAYDGLVNGETSIAGISASTAADESSPVGDYDITVSGTTTNYSPTFVKGTLTITKKAVTVTAENKTKVYGEANPTLSLAYDGLVNSETSIPGLSVSTLANASSPVGDYDITVSGSTANYSLTFVKGTLTITQKAVTVTAENKTKVYGEANPALTLAYDGLVNGETSIAGISASTAADKSYSVGDYPIVLSGSATNYTLTFVDGLLSITPKAVTITAENKSRVYGEMNPALTLAYDGLVNGETSIAGISASTVADESSSVGDYDITVSGTTTNYSPTFVKGTLTITKKAVTVTAENKTKVYGEANPTLSLAYDGLVNSETSIPGLSVSTLANASSPVGDYDLTVSGSTANYSLTFVKGTLTITKKAVTVTAEKKTKVYGEANPALTLAYDGLVNGETSIPGLSVSTMANASSPVGDYDITLSGNTANYSLSFVKGTLTITKKAVTVTAENKTKVYGTANPTLTYTYDGLVNGETSIPGLSVSTLANTSSPVGDYDITVSGNTANYSLTFIKGRLTITMKAVTVTAENKTKVYGKANPVLTLLYDGLVNGETSIAGISASTAADENSSVGDYDITVSGTTTNYSPTFVKGTLTITKKAVTVTAENKTKVYGEANPALTLAYDGLVNGETSIPGLSVSTLANASSPVGDYPIKISGSSRNYTMTIFDGNLKITRKPITITANNQSKLYSERDPVLSYTIHPQLIDNDRILGELDREPGETEGVYRIRQNTLKADANYQLSFISGVFTIEKKVLSGITFRARTVIYDGKEHSLSVDNLPNGAKVTYENNGQTHAGVYTITATVTQQNFQDLILKEVLTINKANAIIDADEIQNYVYDGTIKNVKASLNHNETKLEYSLQQGYANAGTYEIIVSAKETTNYLASTKRIQLIIQQRNWEGLVFKDQEFTYNGKPQSLIVENIPAESRVEYIGNGKIDAGTYQVTARIIDPNFKETVLSANLLIKKAKQKLTFDEIGTLARSIGQVPLNVSTNSGLPITIKSDDVFIASISGNSLLIHRLGTVKLTASQEGNENFEAAVPVSITVQVVDEKLGPIAVHPALSPNGDGINDFLMIEGIKNFPENKVRILTPNGLQVFQIEGYDNDSRVFKGIGNKTGATALLSQGTYFYFIQYKVDGKWEVKKGWFVLKY